MQVEPAGSVDVSVHSSPSAKMDPALASIDAVSAAEQRSADESRAIGERQLLAFVVCVRFKRESMHNPSPADG